MSILFGSVYTLPHHDFNGTGNVVPDFTASISAENIGKTVAVYTRIFKNGEYKHKVVIGTYLRLSEYPNERLLMIMTSASIFKAVSTEQVDYTEDGLIFVRDIHDNGELDGRTVGVTIISQNNAFGKLVKIVTGDECAGLVIRLNDQAPLADEVNESQ